MNASIDLYFWLTPNAWKISIALEEMGLPYRIHPVAIGKGEQFRPEFLTISPNNRLPAIVDPKGTNNSPIVLFESGAILQYLGRKTGKFYPTAEREKTEVEKWLFWQMAGVGPMFGQCAHFHFYAPGLVEDSSRLDYSVQRYDNEVNRLLGVLDRQLQPREFVADAYSIADMALYPWISMSTKLGQDLSMFPAVKGWIERMSARPAVQRGMAAGAEIGQAQPAPDSPERVRFNQLLFGQTAASVARASSAVAAES